MTAPPHTAKSAFQRRDPFALDFIGSTPTGNGCAGFERHMQGTIAGARASTTACRAHETCTAITLSL